MRYEARQQPDDMHNIWTHWGEMSMRAWLSSNWAELNCTALLVHNDDAAVGATSVLNSAGYGIPADLSVVGSDDQPSGRYHRPRLTTVHPQLQEIGALSVKLLSQQIERAGQYNPEMPLSGYQPIALDTSLVVRETARQSSRSICLSFG